jgi:hypothetical protein
MKINIKKLCQSSFLLILTIICGACAMIGNNTSKENVSTEKKILFIGNSYTDQIQKVFKQIVADSTQGNHRLQFIWGGGATLQKLINNGRAFKWIDKDEWDYVVIQDQSLVPAIPGRPQDSFHKSVDTLVKKIRESGAEPILYMTWGRRDIDERHKDLFSDYENMQEKLSKAYREAGKRNKVRVAPVGDAWAIVRKKDDKLGRELYKDDGSHPSTKGAFLASCVFYRLLFDDSLEKVDIPEGIDQKDGKIIKDAVSGIPIAGKL